MFNGVFSVNMSLSMNALCWLTQENQQANAKRCMDLADLTIFDPRDEC
jgi:hypothetical protein